MLTENEARDLLHLAGATIDVPSAEPITLAAKRRPRWPVLAAAAAVVAVVATSVALAQRPGDPQPVEPLVNIPRVDYRGFTVQPSPGQIPSVYGYDEGSASALLSGLGLDVTVAQDEVLDSCEIPGRTVRTQPPTGVNYRPGDHVTLFTSGPRNGFCDDTASQRRFAWQLVDFASGGGPAPAFADQVFVAANHEGTEILGAEAADAENWVDGTPLGVLRQTVRELMQSGRHFQTPYLRVSSSNPRSKCPDWRHPDEPLTLTGMPLTGDGLQISVAFNIDGLTIGCTWLDVFRDDGQVTAVVLRTTSLAPQPGDPTEAQPVIGLTEQTARAALATYGLEAAVVPPPATGVCVSGEPPVVAEQSPAPGDRTIVGSSVTLTMRSVLCGDVGAATPEDLARDLVAWAGGRGSVPAFADQVDVLLGNRLMTTLTAQEASDRSSWRVCFDYPSHACPMSAIVALETVDPEMPTDTFLPMGCAALLAPTPDRTLTEAYIVVTHGEPYTCQQDVEVQIWASAGQITAINLVLGRPDTT